VANTFVKKYSASILPFKGTLHKIVVKYRVMASIKLLNEIGNLVFFLDGAWFTLSRKLNGKNRR
jgi:hypothetical protein